MAAADVEAGEGTFVIDPHGDLVADVLASIPVHRADQVILLRPGDRQRLVSFLLNNCVLVVVSTESRGAALRIFRVLNDRGLDLSNADVIKTTIARGVTDGQLAYAGKRGDQFEPFVFAKQIAASVNENGEFEFSRRDVKADKLGHRALIHEAMQMAPGFRVAKIDDFTIS